MIVVSDTSPLTALLTIGRIELLKAIYQEVHIPPAVAAELQRYHRALPQFVHVSPVRDNTRVMALARELDAGEAEAIILAQELQADFLLIDETIGRAAAQRQGVRVIGLLGVLLIAKKRKLITSVREVLDLLRGRAGFFVSRSVQEEVIRLAGEVP